MDRWWSRPYCARVAESFNLMPWPYKALDLSEILVPLSFTWFAVTANASAVRDGIAPSVLPWFYPATICFVWCWYGARLVLLMRGEQALRRRIVPTSEVKLQNRNKQRNDVIAMTITFGFLASLLLLLNIVMPPDKRSASDFAMPFIYFAMIWQQVVNYSRSRFIAASLKSAI
jgi:hypothetical protein